MQENSQENFKRMNFKPIFFVAILLLPDKTISQDVSLNDRKSFDNSSGTIDLDVDVRGTPGPQGPKGEQGPKGSIGETGVKGDPGMKGDRGLPGDTGPIGTTGNKGETGGKGQKGSRGIQGPIGPTGRPGPPGPRGIQGEPGDTVLNREEFDCVCEATVKKLNESIIAELVEDNRQLKERVRYLEHQQHGIKSLCNISSVNWRRIAYFDTTRGDPCPPGLHTSTNTTSSQRACGTINGTRGQLSLKFPTGGSYTNVCGRVRGYSGWNVFAFHLYSQRGQNTLDTNYADGVLITRGSPRQHLWTYAAGLSETYLTTRNLCPCARSSYNPSWIPSFVGSNYYCETGRLGTGPNRKIWWDDPLWDGQGCVTSGNTCCDRYGWFHRHVPPTTDDIEVRWSKCYTTFSGEDILTDQLEIWVM